ncbi:MAG: hypothetical protein JNK00_06045 [Flavipsychrobacter sp.]|nr:hypothetical protein [Flavipsychrobacter sp.]
MKRKLSYSIVLIGCCIILYACKHKPIQVSPADEYGNFPVEVGKIIVNKCATAGCHNAASYINSGGLLLDSWDHLFNGGNSGAVVVPYSIDYSSLLYFINPDSSLGITAEPRMPLNNTPLTEEEYITIRDWIASGAPDDKGSIPFADKADTRQKIYAIHQGCDEIAVIDVERNVVMRYVQIGIKPYPESATYIRIDKEGRYAYVSMWYDQRIYKIDTRTDKVIGFIDMGDLFWNVLQFSKDGQKIVVTNGDNFDLMQINTVTSQTQKLTNNDFINPHGVASNASFDTFYVASMFGNTVYKFAQGYNKKISIDKLPLTTITGATPDPYDIIMSPDYSKYFISCAKSGEIRILDAKTDSIKKIIPVGAEPQAMVLSKNEPYLFVCCMEDNTVGAGFRGSVYVINYNTLEVVKKIQGKFFQPHSITVDEKNKIFYIFSRNQNYDGPAPHHQGPCSGRNGFYSIYNLNTLEPVNNKRYEVLVDPYMCDSRFK